MVFSCDTCHESQSSKHEDMATLFMMQQVDRLRKSRRPVSRLIGFVAIKLDKELLFAMHQLQI